MKQIKEVIVTPLVHICDISLATVIFPDELKIANVVPIFKSGDDMDYSIYRPVSILPILSNVLERLVYDRLVEFNDKKLLHDFQFEFQRGKSTQLAVMMLVDKVIEAHYIIGTFMYEYMHGNVTDIFNIFFQRNRDIHELDIRNADDRHVLYIATKANIIEANKPQRASVSVFNVCTLVILCNKYRWLDLTTQYAVT